MEFLCHDRYLRKVCPVPAVKSHISPQYGRRNLRVGATMILSNLLTRRGECAVQSQRAMRWGSGNGVRHGMLGDVAHGLNAGQCAIMTHTWKHKQQHRRTCHYRLTRTFTCNADTTGAILRRGADGSTHTADACSLSRADRMQGVHRAPLGKANMFGTTNHSGHD